jgi:hypothetical protein
MADRLGEERLQRLADAGGAEGPLRHRGARWRGRRILRRERLSLTRVPARRPPVAGVGSRGLSRSLRRARASLRRLRGGLRDRARSVLDRDRRDRRTRVVGLRAQGRDRRDGRRRLGAAPRSRSRSVHPESDRACAAGDRAEDRLARTILDLTPTCGRGAWQSARPRRRASEGKGSRT